MMQIAPDKQRTRVQAQQAALWRQAQALADQIAQAGGESHHGQALKLEALRRRSTQLAEHGAALDLQRSESESIDHGRPGRRWRPTVAQPF